MSEEVVVPTLYVAFMVCSRGASLEVALANLDQQQAQRVIRHYLAKRWLARRKGRWSHNESLCKAYEQYVECYKQNIVYAHGPAAALEVMYTCLQLAGLI